MGGAAIVGATDRRARATRDRLDYEICERAWTGEASERSFDHLLEHGMPEDEARTVLETGSS